MGITRLKVSNFKSFDELDLELRPLNVVVGANAAGKSNFLEVFRFLRDLAESGLENAISLQGGIGYLANRKIGSTRPTSVEVTSQFAAMAGLPHWSGWANGATWETIELEVTYSLGLQAGGPQGFEIIREEIAHLCHVRRQQLGPRPPFQEGPWQFRVLRAGNGIQRAVTRAGKEALGVDFDPQIHEGFPDLVRPLSPNESLLRRSNEPVIPDIAVFDFDPRLPKKAAPITGRVDLDPDGGNLAIALKSILSDPERAARFSRLLRDLLPFVEDLRVENLADKSLLFLLRETYSGEDYLPAAFLSNGTIQIAAVLLALYFDRADITVVEEPERNIHPHLISRVVAMMKDAAETRQVVTTTHNPELVKHAELADLLLVSRAENGFSRISRPAENEELKVFLENELGVDELYVQNLLGVGHGV
jgi:predicted ATPase